MRGCRGGSLAFRAMKGCRSEVTCPQGNEGVKVFLLLQDGLLKPVAGARRGERGRLGFFMQQLPLAGPSCFCKMVSQTACRSTKRRKGGGTAFFSLCLLHATEPLAGEGSPLPFPPTFCVGPLTTREQEEGAGQIWRALLSAPWPRHDPVCLLQQPYLNLLLLWLGKESLGDLT